MDIKLLAIDLAKESFQLRGIDATGKTILKKNLSRQELPLFVVNLAPCRIAMEGCGGAHYWGRKFTQMGHEVNIIAAKFVKPFLMSQKNDDNDCQAIGEAASRPSMRFIAVKTVAQQDLQSLHRVRQGLVKAKTALANQCRGLLMEYGVTIKKGITNFEKEMPCCLEEAGNELTFSIRDLLQLQFNLFRTLCAQEDEILKRIKALGKTQPDYERILNVPGVGPLSASLFLASVGSANVFKNGRQLAAWVGLVPRQNSTGGKARLLGITKAGDSQLRAMLIHGARALILSAKKNNKQDKRSKWIMALVEKRGWNVASVAIANRNCRIMWSLMKHQTEYQAI